MQKIGYWIGGLVVLLGAFLLTNWFLSIEDPLDWKFTDEASLATVAQSAGFHSSKDLGGHVDTVARIDAGHVRANGWVADLTGDGSPIILNAFVNGRNVATFRTDGPRLDITAGVKANPKANPDAAKNTQFASIFSCAAGDKLLVVATTVTKAFILLTPEPLVCP